MVKKVLSRTLNNLAFLDILLFTLGFVYYKSRTLCAQKTLNKRADEILRQTTIIDKEIEEKKKVRRQEIKKRNISILNKF